MNLIGPQLEITLPQGNNTGEVLIEGARLEDWGTGGVVTGGYGAISSSPSKLVRPRLLIHRAQRPR